MRRKRHRSGQVEEELTADGGAERDGKSRVVGGFFSRARPSSGEVDERLQSLLEFVRKFFDPHERDQRCCELGQLGDEQAVSQSPPVSLSLFATESNEIQHEEEGDDQEGDRATRLSHVGEVPHQQREPGREYISAVELSVQVEGGGGSGGQATGHENTDHGTPPDAVGHHHKHRKHSPDDRGREDRPSESASP